MHTWPPVREHRSSHQCLHATRLRWLLIACVSLIGALGVLVMPATSLGATGDTWTVQTPASVNDWESVTYGNGLFVAVSSTSYGASNNKVMTSPDGVNWTIRTNPVDNWWSSVTYGTVSGSPLFVAVAYDGSGNRVMTSPNGIDWTSRASAANNIWTSVTYGNGLFVAVAQSGSGNRVMTSPNGIDWTSRDSAVDSNWASVTYGNGLFVAVAWTGDGNQVMTSPNGITWTSQSIPSAVSWQSVTYGNGLFVAVASNGAVASQVMTSPNGITWTSQTAAADNNWLSVTYGGGLFVAVSNAGMYYKVMTSPDGSTWTSRAAATLTSQWSSVTYGNGLFVAVSKSSGGSSQVMTSGALSGALIPPTPATPTATAGNTWATITVAQGSGPGGTPDSYTVTAVGNNTKTCTVTGAAGSCTITGLTNGTSYTFTATATNTGGTSAASGASAAVTPTAPVNFFAMKTPVSSVRFITTQLSLPGAGRVLQKGTIRRPTSRASSEMAKKAGTLIVCTARKTVTKAGTVTITCRLTAKARAARKTHSLKVSLVTTFTPTDGTAYSVTRTLVLKKTR